MKKYLLLLVYILSTLACSLTPTYTKATPAAPPVTVTVNAPAVKFVASTAPPLVTITPAVNTGFPVMLAVGDVNIRAAPSTDSAVVGWLLEGQGVEVFAIADGWAETKQGYIKAEWLK